MLALLLVATLTGPPATDLLGLADCPLGSELPAEWRLRPVSGVPVPDFRVDRLAGERVAAELRALVWEPAPLDG